MFSPTSVKVNAFVTAFFLALEKKELLQLCGFWLSNVQYMEKPSISRLSKKLTLTVYFSCIKMSI